MPSTLPAQILLYGLAMLRICCTLFGLLTIGCAADVEVVLDDGAVDLRVSHQVMSLSVPERQVWLFVVDDADTAVAASLRQAVAEAVRLPEGGPYPASKTACPGGSQDPSHEDWRDIRAIVAHAELGDAQRLTTPHEVTDLARVGERDDLEAHERWVQALQSELLRAPVGAHNSYAPLETISDTMALLAGQREPNSPREVDQLAALGGTNPAVVSIFFLTTRDDGSPGAPASYDISAYGSEANDYLAYPDARLLLSTEAGSYSTQLADLEHFERLASFFRPFTTKQASSDLHLATSADGLFDQTGLSVSMASTCFGSTPVRHDDGAVDCRVHITTLDLSPCDRSRGWLNPLSDYSAERVPRTQTIDGKEVRICEVKQLEGDELERCLTHPEIAPDAGGFCYPEQPDACRARCGSDSGYPLDGFRFLGEATRVTAPSRLYVDCSLDTALPQ